MASSRRGGPPDLKGTLGTLLRTTLNQVGAVKDAAMRQAQTQRTWLDAALLDRKRRDALAELGEITFERAVQGSLNELEDDRRAAELVADIDELDRRMAEHEARGRGGADEAVSSAAWGGGQRFHRGRGHQEVRVWRPVMPDEDALDDPLDDDAPETAEPRARRGRRRGRGEGRGGIAFVTDARDPDDDLEEYMHPDDVPADGED